MNHDQHGHRIDVEIPQGDSLRLLVGVMVDGVEVTLADLALVCEAHIEAWNEPETVVAPLSVGNSENALVVSGGSEVAVGTYWWRLRHTGEDRGLASGLYRVTKQQGA